MEDPAQVLEQCKNIYLQKTEKETGYSKDDIVESYDLGIKMLNSLKSIRNNRSRTVRYLKVKAYRNCYKCDVSLLETWLIQSMVEDDTYLYAYNYLSQKANKEEGCVMFKVKVLSDLDVFKLLENERISNSERLLPKKNGSELSVKQIALISIYNDIQITRSNAKEIANKYGFASNTSGEGLYQDYTFFLSRANRIGNPSPFTQQKLKNKILLFESVSQYLKVEAREMAEDEIKCLKNRLEAEFE